ncbi:MAG: hypothetical protein FWF42_03975 [Streptococcaceae bacterium]|nr:hypothetical protein [Streptococcaceae bacterium]
MENIEKRKTGFAITAGILIIIVWLLSVISELCYMIGNWIIKQGSNTLSVVLLVYSIHLLFYGIYLLITRRKSKSWLVVFGIALIVFPVIYLLIRLLFSQHVTWVSYVWGCVNIVSGALVIVQSLMKKRQVWVFILLWIYIGVDFVLNIISTNWHIILLDFHVSITYGDKAGLVYSLGGTLNFMNEIIFDIAFLFFTFFFWKIAKEKQSKDVIQ